MGDLLAYYRRLGNNYAQAIGQSGVKCVVNLSSIGAHLDRGSGILLGAHDVEQILNKYANHPPSCCSKQLTLICSVWVESYNFQIENLFSTAKSLGGLAIISDRLRQQFY